MAGFGSDDRVGLFATSYVRARVCRRSTGQSFGLRPKAASTTKYNICLGDGREITAAYLQTDVDTRCAGNRNANEAAAAKIGIRACTGSKSNASKFSSAQRLC